MGKEIVLISGGLGDIGSAIAIFFGKKGHRVAICDKQEDKDAVSRLEELRSGGCGDLLYRKVDVTSEEQIASWLEEVETQWGIAQVIIPNAGIVVQGAFTDPEQKISRVRKQLEVNFWGCHHLAVLGAAKLRTAGLPGRIVFMGSWAAERPMARISSYCVSKAAVRMLCKTLALELAPYDILVNEIAPGIVEGGLSRKNQQKDPELLKTHLEAIPVHKLIPVMEVAAQVYRLADFNNTSITGSTITLDGGLSLTSKMTP